MAKLRRFNSILTVDDSQVNYYVNLGYDVIDDKGSVIRKAIPNDVHTLQKELRDATATIEQLKAENAKLKEALAVKPDTTDKPSTRRKKAVEE